MRLSSFSIIIIFVALMLVGAALLPRLGIRLYPSATLPSLTISFSWPDAPAINMEREVTSRIEGALSTLRDIENISSVSSYSSGRVELEFKKNADIELARFETASQLRRIYPDLPEGVSFPVISVGRAVGRQNPLLIYTFVAPSPGSVIEKYLERNIIPLLSNVNGVERINAYGATPMEYRIVYDTEKLRSRNITVEDLQRALQSHFGHIYLGMEYLSQHHRGHKGKLPVTLLANPYDKPDWQNIPVGKAGQRIIFLTDIAEIRYQEQDPARYYRFNGQNTIGMRIYAGERENQVRLAATVRKKVNELQTSLPEGWTVRIAYDDTQHIRNDLRRVGLRMLFSFSILMLFVILVTRKPGYLFLILATITANLLLAVSWYYFLGIEMHLYSLAGITVSFGIIIDNGIVMIEHMRRHKNKKVFLAILAATLTTVGCLSVIFLLEPVQQAQLQDFAAVVLVNLLLSLVVAWFFVPAVFPRLKMGGAGVDIKNSRRTIRFSRVYFRGLVLARRFRWLMLIVFILGFGLPVHRLPAFIDDDSLGARMYNATIGSGFYQSRMKNTAEKVLGGSFRLFSQYVFERSYFTDPERTAINVRGRMPDGATVHQLNEVILQMEHFLSQFREIEQFETRVLSPQNGTIRILFKPEYDRGAFPLYLQNQIIRKAISIGGAEWWVSGVGRGFSNVMGGSSTGMNRVLLEGYNYDHLYRYAEILQQRALENPRIIEAEIQGGEVWAATGRLEFFLNFDRERLALHELSPGDIYRPLTALVMESRAPRVYHQYSPVTVQLRPDLHHNYTLWDMAHIPLTIRNVAYKTGEFLSMEKRPSGNNIHKINQQYRLFLAYRFLGPPALEQRAREALIQDGNEIMPMGFRVSEHRFVWRTDESRQYFLILLVIVIIYFICAILLESLLQPLAIIGLIPVSFIGLFLTFYIFGLNFDQGGLAAFILLSGLAVNAGLYILNDYNNFLKKLPGREPLRLYMKAFQYKIMPVMLTVFSTLIGLIPFVIGQKEAFWYAFAAGTMGGLAFSLPGIFIFFPVFIKMRKPKTEMEMQVSSTVRK